MILFSKIVRVVDIRRVDLHGNMAKTDLPRLNFHRSPDLDQVVFI